MPILSRSSRNALSQRLAVACIYTLLSVLGLTMVVPFLMTLTLSVSNPYDYKRFSPFPRYFVSDEDRFVKFLSLYFNSFAGWQGQMAAYFPDLPASWTTWDAIGEDLDGSTEFARGRLEQSQSAFTGTQARDYADFCDAYPVDDCVANIDQGDADAYLTREFTRRWIAQNEPASANASDSQKIAAALNLLRRTWRIPFTDFNQINFNIEMKSPMWQQSWFPAQDPKAQSFTAVKQAYRDLQYMTGIHAKWRDFLRSNGVTDNVEFAPQGPPAAHALWLKFREQVAPASLVIPYALRVTWRNFLQSEEVRAILHLGPTDSFDLSYYNRMAGTHYQNWDETPFPLPASAPAILQQLWTAYTGQYPARLTTLSVTPDLTARYQAFLQGRYQTIASANQLLGTNAAQWTDFSLPAEAPNIAHAAGLRSAWAAFVKTVPPALRQLHSSESAFQEFMLARYGNLDAINQAWGTHYTTIEEVFPPFAAAYAITFQQNRIDFVLKCLTANYSFVGALLFRHADAVPVTLVLIALSILSSLTINPLAAYALSRFNMRGQDKIILFLLATSAFPAMISAIPGFLLMRDLGLLNTFFALVLPGAASGMGIFILKGFFDSLPPELFEAATIDGAREWQIFLNVTMPLVKPILAVNALGAFIGAYEGWQWALIVCQNQKMWTLSVWMYQVSQVWSWAPWITSAGYVVISIPTLIVFLTCQRIILQGIIIPQMK